MAMIRLQMFVYPDEDVSQSGAWVNNIEKEATENNIFLMSWGHMIQARTKK